MGSRRKLKSTNLRGLCAILLKRGHPVEYCRVHKCIHYICEHGGSAFDIVQSGKDLFEIHYPGDRDTIWGPGDFILEIIDLPDEEGGNYGSFPSKVR